MADLIERFNQLVAALVEAAGNFLPIEVWLPGEDLGYPARLPVAYAAGREPGNVLTDDVLEQ